MSAHVSRNKESHSGLEQEDEQMMTKFAFLVELIIQIFLLTVSSSNELELDSFEIKVIYLKNEYI